MMNDDFAKQETIDVGVYALAVSPAFAADGVCFAGSASGLLVARGGQRKFADAYASLKLPQRLATPAVALSPAFTADGTVFAGVHGAVLRSHDRGATWQYAALRTPPPAVACLAISPTYEQDGTVFAGTLGDGVFRSGDRGSRWAAWNFGLIDLGVLCLALSPAFGQDETLVAGTETGLFRSTNGGRAWRELGLPTELAPVLSIAFSPFYAQDGVLVAGTESSGLWLSKDRGRSWELIEAVGDGAINALVIQPVSNQVGLVVLADESIVVSRDGGQSWSAIPSDVLNTPPLCLAAPLGLERDQPLLVGCVDGGVQVLRL